MQFVNLRRTGCLGMYFWTSLAINVSTSQDLPTATATSIHDKVACVITAYYIWEEIADRTKPEFALGAYFKARTFHSPSNISSDSQPFLELSFAFFWFLMS